MTLQNAELEQNPSFKDIYFSKTFNKKSDKAVFTHAEKNYWPNLSGDEQVTVFTTAIEQILSLVNLREQFEVQLLEYGPSRAALEDAATKVESIIGILESLEEDDAASATIAGTIKHVLTKGFDTAISTGRCLNNMCLWSMLVEPHPEYMGNLSWYSFYHKIRPKLILNRKPWHQYVHMFEANDISGTVKRLTDAVTVVQQYGITVDTKDVQRLLSAKEGQTLEGQRILFPALYQQDVQNMEDGELRHSPAPSQTDMDILTGKWMKKVSLKAEGGKDEEDEEDEDEDEEDTEDVNLSQYDDAKTSKSPPLESSAVKNLIC